jgi:hypothetical protein
MKTFEIPTVYHPIIVRALRNLVGHYAKRRVQSEPRRFDEDVLREMAQGALHHLGEEVGACMACGRRPEPTATPPENETDE